MKKILFIGLGLFLLAGCGEEKKVPPVEKAVEPVAKTPDIHFSVVARYPHDKTAYTEGFVFHDGKLYESTGNNWSTSNGSEQYGYLPQTKSAFGAVDLQKGILDVKAELDKKIYFGEGIVFLNGKVYQVTYKNQTGFVYDAKSFNKLGQFNYPNKEGWGLTTEGQHIIMSDGTSILTFFDPQNYSVVKTLEVSENGFAVDKLNELEYIKGFIYANVWMTNRIVKIDPATGVVVGALDLTQVFEEARSKDIYLNELNGIAYDATSSKVLVTGKLWPEIYEISFEL